MTAFEHLIFVSVGETYIVAAPKIQQAAIAALEAGQYDGPASMTVVITTEEHVQHLNKDFAGLDKSTDVLTFGAEGELYETEADEPPYLGDIVIAYKIAENQALKRHQPVINELQRLTIHGVMHLLGFDHGTAEEQADMWAVESIALNALQSE